MLARARVWVKENMNIKITPNIFNTKYTSFQKKDNTSPAKINNNTPTDTFEMSLGYVNDIHGVYTQNSKLFGETLYTETVSCRKCAKRTFFALHRRLPVVK